jgi:single-stranded DNA-specific DHH superfamily exonuclease
VLYEGFTNNKKFFLQVDSDTDGYTSSAIFYSFFKRLFPEARIE